MRFILPALFFTSLLLLSACGQKGPLYLPQSATEAATNEQAKSDTDTNAE